MLAGAQVNDATPQKKNALHIAAEHDQASIASILLQNEIDFETIDSQWNNGQSDHNVFLCRMTCRPNEIKFNLLSIRC